MSDFFLIWNEEFVYSEIIPNYETIFLWFQQENKKIRVYYPFDTTNVVKMTVNRRVQSIVRSGYFHPSGNRVGQGYEIENVEQYEQFHQERLKTESKDNITPAQWLEIMEEKARKITGSKLKELDLPTVDVNVKIFANTFEVFDSTTKERLNKVNFYDEAHIESGEMFGNQKGFKIRTSLKEDIQYKFTILKPISNLLTDVLMLLGLNYNQEENRGFYFGSFEIGEFTINKDTGELEILKKFSNITHAYSFLLTSDNNILIGFQNGFMQYINWDLNQMLIWDSSEAAPASIHSLAEWEKYYIAGLNDGSIKLFNKIDGKIIKSHQVAELSITHLAVSGYFVIAGVEDGSKLFCFDLEREISKWNVSLRKGKFISVETQGEEKVVVYTENGFKFTIEVGTGSIREQNLGHHITCRPSKLGPWELLGSKNHLLYGNQITPTMERQDTEYSRISSIIVIHGGILISCLDGKIEFLKKIVMEQF